MNLRQSVLAAFLVLSLSVLIVGTADALFPAEIMRNPLNMLVLGTSIFGIIAGLLFSEALHSGDRGIESVGGKVRVMVPAALIVGLIILFSSGFIGQLSNLVLVISVGYTILLVALIFTGLPGRRSEEVRDSGGTRTDESDSALEDRQDS